MKIAFRVDSSTQIGSGHLMRCLTLAESLRGERVEVLFLCRDLDGNLSQLVRDKGFDVTLLSKPDKHAAHLDWNAHAVWLGVSREQDVADCKELLQEIGPVDWLIVDHYALDHIWQSALRSLVKKIMVIDDLADRKHDCDMLLDQNLYDDLEHRYNSLVSENCRKLLGPKFALLRPEFRTYRFKKAPFSGYVKRIVFFFGGSDAENMTEKALRALNTVNMDLENLISAEVVVGKSNVHKQAIQTLCDMLPWANFHCQIDNMAELMANVDLSMGAVGVTTWERCCLGVPTLAVSVAENQLEMARKGGRDGLFFYLGHGSDVSEVKIESALKAFVNCAENLVPYASRSAKIVDGLGCRRVIDFLVPDNVTLRYAVKGDRDNIYQWRVAEETRKHLFNNDAFSLESHNEWFGKALEEPDRILLIGEIDDSPIGVVRFDLLGDNAVISIYMVPELSGQGLGKKLVRAATAWGRANLHKSASIRAEILPENEASIRVFESSDYREMNRTYVINLKT